MDGWRAMCSYTTTRKQEEEEEDAASAAATAKSLEHLVFAGAAGAAAHRPASIACAISE